MPAIIKIDNAISTYPTIDDSIEFLSQAFKQTQVTFFAGAGISAPSGLPLAKELINAIVEAIMQAIEIVKVGTIKEREELKDCLIEKYALERLLDLLVRILGNESLKVLSVLESGRPNYNHLVTAKLAKVGYLNAIVTLNFDILFEEAFHQLGVPFEWHLPLASTVMLKKEYPTKIMITKPHGSIRFKEFKYEEYFLAAALRDVGNHPQKENEIEINTIAKKYPVLLMAGYSDNDWDISPILTMAPWHHVFWVHHADLQKQPNTSIKESSERIYKWFERKRFDSQALIYGDIRNVFRLILNRLSLESPIDKEDVYVKKPAIDYFLSRPQATAFAAINMIDGLNNKLYRSLLPQLGECKAVINDPEIYNTWKRAMAWLNHAHYAYLYKSVKQCHQVLKDSLNNEKDDFIILDDIYSAYYGYLSILKRLYLILLWPIPLYKTLKYRKMIKNLSDKILANKKTMHWTKKEVSNYIGLTKYSVVDLYHHWGYYLLPFQNKLFLLITKKLFWFIAFKYNKITEEYTDFDWGYHYVRKVEANLLARQPCPEITEGKLRDISEMFQRTGELGHQDYTESVLALLCRNFNCFKQARNSMFDKDRAATPTGNIRMYLFQRYFWPESVSTLKTLYNIFWHSTNKPISGG